MTSVTKLFCAIALVLALSLAAFGQATLSQTTLAAAVSGPYTGATGAARFPQTIYLTSVSGIVAPANPTSTTEIGTPSGSSFTILYVQDPGSTKGEAMQVFSINTTLNTVVVNRGYLGTMATAHGTGATVWFGPPEYFANADLSGACTTTALRVLPFIVPGSGHFFDCIGGYWVEALPSFTNFTSYSATPGTVRALRGEAITYSSQSSGNLVGVRGAVTAATGASLTGGYFYGAQGKAITGTATINIGSGDFAGVYGQLDVTGGTLTSGHVAPLESNLFGATTGTHGSALPIDQLYMEHAAGGVIRDAIHIFGKMDYLIDFESNSDLGYAVSTTCQPGNISTTGAIRILVDGTAKYIPLVSNGTCN